MTSVLKCISNIIKNQNITLSEGRQGRNRINNVGNALEDFVKDSFAATYNKTESKKLIEFKKIFSYQGNQNNPPDLILKNSDAVEVKKIQSKNSALALNSSYPKDKLYSDSPMITKACKECENWNVKDIVYMVGHTTDKELKYLWIVYGTCFAADKSVYQRIKNKISDGVNELSDIEFTTTKELAKIKKVDPLGITDLRVRGMWHIQNPNKIFNYVQQPDIHSGDSFKLIGIIPTTKFNNFPESDKNELLSLKNSNFSISDINVKNPNNPVKLIKCKLIFHKG